MAEMLGPSRAVDALDASGTADTHPGAGSGGVDKQQRDWGSLVHLAALSGILLPPLWVLGPLLVWLAHRRTMPFVRRHGRTALEFQVTMSLLGVGAYFLTTMNSAFLWLLGAVILGDILLTVLAASKANQGVPYTYPIAIPFFGRREPDGVAVPLK